MRDLRQEGLQIRPVRPEDASRVVQFLNQVFGTWGSLEDWHWKYQAPPASFRTDSILAEWPAASPPQRGLAKRGTDLPHTEEAGERHIIGHYGMLPLAATWGGQEVRAAQSVDAAVLPAWRRQGVFTAMAAEVLGRAVGAGVSLLYAFPGLNSLGLDLRHGYRSVAFVPEMVRILHLRRALALTARQLPRDLGTLWGMRRPAGWTPAAVARADQLRRALLLVASWVSAPPQSGAALRRCLPRNRRESSRAKPLILRPVEHFDARFDGLWASQRHTIELGLRKDARYLAWRYGRRVSRTYAIIVTEEEERLLGCVVMRHSGLRSEVAELLAVPERPDVVTRLIAAAVAGARSAGSVLLSAWAPAGQPLHNCLHRSGFVSAARLHQMAGRWPAVARVFYQVIAYTGHLSPEQQADLAARAGAWPLSMGDSDLV